MAARGCRRIWSAVVVLVLAGSLQVAGPAGAVGAPTAANTARRVELTGLTTETRQVFANPNGTFTSVLSALPVRVRQGNGWRSVDTTLHINGDTTVSPVAASLDMVFSGGGDGPLVRLRRDGR